jgi:ribosomal protein L16
LRYQLALRKVTFVKQHKGIVPIPTGRSTKGTTLAYGDWGLRIKGQGVRLTAKQLTTAEEVIMRKIKPIKGAKLYLQVFPHVPVCINVCRVFNMGFTGLVDTIYGKGKGTFEYWALSEAEYP